MSDKLRAAAQAALDLLDNDDRDCAFAAGILRVALAEPEQEPVGKFSKFSDGVWKEVTASSPGIFLYTAPPRKEWVGLTDREFQPMIQKAMAYYGYDQSKTSHLTAGAGFRVFANAIEAKLREKNG